MSDFILRHRDVRVWSANTFRSLLLSDLGTHKHMKLSLTVIAGPDQGNSFELPVGKTLVLGRGDQADIRVNDPAVSRTHFEASNQGDGLLVADRGSRSGLFVDGNKVETASVSAGAVLQFGDTRMRVTVVGEPTMATAAPTIEEKPLPKMVGEKLGPYHLQSVIGKGASGVVFKAHDEEKDRVAAVKVLSPTFTSSDEQRQRFVRAMKTMLPIRSPRILRLYNAGKNGPYCWAAMEYVEGDNLADLIERIGIDGMLDWKEVWHTTIDIAQALNTAHENKIVHRNVTPKNILRRDSDKACLLGDLMLAKALEGTLAQDVTSPGQILGELNYLAPERTRGDSEIDTRSDLYGLGATCYALLTGRPPVSGSSMVDVIKNVREQKPEPPKKFQLSVNELFQDLIMTLIEKDPDARVQTPAKLISELLRIGKFNGLQAKI